MRRPVKNSSCRSGRSSDPMARSLASKNRLGRAEDAEGIRIDRLKAEFRQIHGRQGPRFRVSIATPTAGPASAIRNAPMKGGAAVPYILSGQRQTIVWERATAPGFNI